MIMPQQSCQMTLIIIATHLLNYAVREYTKQNKQQNYKINQ